MARIRNGSGPERRGRREDSAPPDDEAIREALIARLRKRLAGRTKLA